jgi:hypothetical protein
MANQRSRRSIAALATAGIAIVAVLGGTSYAATRPSHPAATSHHPKSLSKADVRKIVKSYVTKHVAQPIEFGAITTSSSGGGPIKTIGPWTINLNCDATGAAITVTGPGVAGGANTLGPTNGSAGSSFETFGGVGGKNGAGGGFQASQTLILSTESHSYTVTYVANADTSSPVDCDVIGYAIPLQQ